MQNQVIEFIYENIYQTNENKSFQDLKIKAQSLGIQIKSYFPKERILFTVAQIIVDYLDSHILQTKEAENKQNKNKITENKNKLPIRNQYTSSIISYHFSLAVYFLYYFCGPPYNIWETINKIKQAEKIFINDDDNILQGMKPNPHVNVLENYQSFNCICFTSRHNLQNIDRIKTLKCSDCKKEYHPDCQYQKLLCNKCFLINYFFPIDSKFFSVFGQGRRIKTYFYSNLNFFNTENAKKNHFFIIKFDVYDHKQLNNAVEPQFMIKIINFSQLQNSKKQSPQYQRWQNMRKNAWQNQIILNFHRFQIFLNFTALKRKNIMFQNENSLIFKIQNRLPQQKGNILFIKCDPGFYQNDQYIITLQRISKIKRSNNKQIREYEQSQGFIDQISNKIQNLKTLQKQKKQDNVIRLTEEQLKCFKNFQQKNKLNKIKEQNIIESSQDQSEQYKYKAKKKKNQLVRSFGCNHKQGFNLAEIKKIHLDQIKFKKINQKKDQKIKQIQKMIQQLFVKVYRQYWEKNKIKFQNQEIDQESQFNTTNIFRIKRFCVEKDLLKNIQIPKQQKYDQEIMISVLRKFGFNKSSNSTNKYFTFKKSKEQILQKEQKRFTKFVKCKICGNHLYNLYLMPQQNKRGEPLRQKLKNNIKKTKRIKKSKKTKGNLKKNQNKKHYKQQRQKLLIQIFKPQRINHAQIFKKNNNYKKQQQSQEQNNQYLQKELFFEQQNKQLKFNSVENYIEMQREQKIINEREKKQYQLQVQSNKIKQIESEDQQGQLSCQQIVILNQQNKQFNRRKINQRDLKQNFEDSIIDQNQKLFQVMQQESSYYSSVNQFQIQSSQKQFLQPQPTNNFDEIFKKIQSKIQKKQIQNKQCQKIDIQFLQDSQQGELKQLYDQIVF